MFGLFKKKRCEPSKALHFKCIQDAFEYACKYCITTLENEQPVLGIVLGSKGNQYCIKLSNDTDPSVPSVTPDELLKRGDIRNTCFAAMPIDAVPPLITGDLVLYVAPAELAALGKGWMTGIIVAKVQPSIDIQTGRWLLAK